MACCMTEIMFFFSLIYKYTIYTINEYKYHKHIIGTYLHIIVYRKTILYFIIKSENDVH